jgi:hypothetical protein
LLALPAGVIAVTESGDLVRLEARAARWDITARARVNALQDGRVTLADLEGDGDAEVVALLQPNAERYRHGVLGDTLEPTAVAVFERHSLEELWRFSVPEPFVFEDLMARPVRLGNRDRLVVVRAGPNGGAALGLLSLTGGGLQLTTSPDFRQPNRWLNPVVASDRLYAVVTPHIGGVLTRYAIQNNTLTPESLHPGVSNHAIGSRNLEPGLVTRNGNLILPSQDHQDILQLECAKTCAVKTKTRLGGRYSSNLIRFDDRTVVIGDESKRLHFIEVNP